ncbi:hypothetical protein BH09MYX1_BH09MYX1_02680 [soil metagenome]
MALAGVLGSPWIDLEGVLDLSPIAEIHDEICLALSSIAVDYTGGSHRSMGIVPPSHAAESWVDYGEAIERMTDADFSTFVGLADRAEDRAAKRDATFGEERSVPLSRRQMLWLKYRFGVYFPWKVYVEMIPNQRWEDKSDAAGKSFTRIARALFPKTLAFVETLPFTHVGRCNLMGLEANDFGTVHRDGVPGDKPDADHFITLCPAKNKTLYLWDEASKTKTPVSAKAYWFNDSDYHGVEPAPFFRYSLRVDGVFRPEFLAQLRDLPKTKAA